MKGKSSLLFAFILSLTVTGPTAVAGSSGQHAASGAWQNLVASVRMGDVKTVEAIIARTPELLPRQDVYGWTLLHHAANAGEVRMVEWLVKRVDLNRRDPAGRTAHNLASARGLTEAAAVIARAGGDTSPAKFPVLKGPYLGQAPPGLTPQIFAPGIVSTPDLREMSGTVSADGREIYFYRQLDTHTKDAELFGCRIIGDAWAPPQRVAETAGYPASMPYLARDNQRLYFRWLRPAPDADPTVGGMWVLNRRGDGWSEPTFAGPGTSVSSSLDGQLYVTDAEPPEAAYLAKVTERHGRFAGYERLGIQPGFGGQSNPAIAPDGGYVIFDYQGGLMHVSFKKMDGTWGEAIDLTPHGFGPLASSATISADGKYLFFKQGEPNSVSGDSSNRDLYWVDIRVIENLRPKEGR